MGVFYEFDSVDGFGVGAVGVPGSRVFYVQARQGTMQLDIKCEKQQVAAIADYVRKVLTDLPVPDHAAIDAGIEQPVNAAFVLGPVGLGYSREHDRLMLQFDEMVLDDDDGDALDRGHVRLFITREQAHAFCRHADDVVAGGRPPCRWCDLPIDPTGHACPRMN